MWTFPLTRSAHQIWHISIAFWPTSEYFALRPGKRSTSSSDANGITYCCNTGCRDAGVSAFLVSFACCGNMDCFPVACDQLVQTGSGWLYVPTGNLFQREQVQPSQDHHCHVCLGRTGDHRWICAFIVPNA